MPVDLAGGASTQSRGRRPLPAGVVSAVSDTANSIGVRELIEFTRADKTRYTRECLSWVVGQSGILWGHGPYPPEIMREFARWEVPGSYGNRAEWALADALGDVYFGRLNSDDLAVRFFANAGDACAAAARVARNATARDVLASYGYHGATTDWAHEPASAGVPDWMIKRHRRFEWGDVAGMQAAASQAACIMVEVPPVDSFTAREFLAACRATADALTIPFIIDDTVLGFRLALAGSSEYYGVRPDMVILGKAMSAIGGVAAVLGRRDLVGALGTEVFYSTTFGGHPMLCGIAAATVRHLTAYQSGIYGESGYLRSIGRPLQDGLNNLGLSCVGQPERSVLIFPNDAERRAFCSRMIEHDVSMDRPQFPTLAHTTNDVERTLAAADKVING